MKRIQKENIYGRKILFDFLLPSIPQFFIYHSFKNDVIAFQSANTAYANPTCDSLVNLSVQLNLTIELNRFTFIMIFEANERPTEEKGRRTEQANNGM